MHTKIQNPSRRVSRRMSDFQEEGSWLGPPKVSRKGSIYIRGCYGELYTDIKDLVTLGKSYIHISGNPGIGKSCFLWYVLKRLLSEANTVIVELVTGSLGCFQVSTFVFTPDGKVVRVASAKASEYYHVPGVWLLTDQLFVGNMSAGTTVLFASPKEENWVQAQKTMLESEFMALYMPPWSIEELKRLFFRTHPHRVRYLREFWMRYYLAGPIARYYFIPLETVYHKIKMALTKIVENGVVNATLFDGGVDHGQFSHKIFVSWPTLDYMNVKQITFLSEWVADSFAIACYRGKVKDWISSTLALASEPLLRSTAGVLFERYAHHRLSLGGEFHSCDDPEKDLQLEKWETRFFNGNKLHLSGLDGLCYLRPNSSSFPLIDSAYLPYLLFQMSIALDRKPMKKSNYDALCSEMMEFSRNYPNVPSGLRGVEPDQVYVVLVKMEGDNATQATGLRLVEDVPEVAQLEPKPAAAGKRKRQKTGAVTEKTISTNKQEKRAKPKTKTSFIPFQMTIALKMDDVVNSLDYATLEDIHRIVTSRMSVRGVDTGSSEYGDITREKVDAAYAALLMRGGMGSIQYNEKEDGISTFGVWIEAVRHGCENDMEETVVNIQCTSGEFVGRELTVFINERIGTEVKFMDPVVLTMHGDGVTSKIVSEEGCAYEFSWSGDNASVVIKSSHRDSRKFRLIFAGGEEDKVLTGGEEDAMDL